MPLQQLVEYFNDRLEHEHNDGFRPFVLHQGEVRGLFGPIRIGSILTPIRETLRTVQTIGYSAQLSVTTHNAPNLQSNELATLLEATPGPQPNSDSIVNFDRLSRTVHMLNYLPQAHLDKLLFLDVDPRHILGVKQDHGAYFEEIIIKCGLQTANVTIALTISNAYARLYPSLLKGLENYQRRGYRLALKFDPHSLEKSGTELIARAAPDFVALSAQQLERVRDNRLPARLQQLTSLVHSIGGRGILLDIDDKRAAALARKTGFDLVQGGFFENPVTDRSAKQQPFASDDRTVGQSAYSSHSPSSRRTAIKTS